jgi:hypothetical protein
MPALARRVAAPLIALACLFGCSRPYRPPLGAVDGTVTLDGRPLPDATVLFTPDGRGRTSQGLTDSAGCYRLFYLRDIAGANPGRHTVRITTASEENGRREMLPRRYHAKTILEATVAPGDNRCDFDLQSR